MPKNIIILTTGGTITGHKIAGPNSTYESAKLSFDEIFSPALKKLASKILNINIKIKNILNIGSQDMNNQHLLKLAKEVQQASKQNDGVVIIHGTDSIEESAYFLNLVLKTSANIVLTGSMHTKDSLVFDGVANIYGALIVASSQNAKNLGVLAVFDNKIYSARQLYKTHSRSLGAFSGQIGMVVDNKAIFYFQSSKDHTLNTPFDIAKINNLAKVDVIYICADFNEKLYDFSQSDAVILCAMGNANLPKNALKTLSKLKILKVRTSRTNAVDISKDGEIDDEKFGFIRANDLAASKARVLLMCALSQTKNAKLIQGFFDRF